MSFCRIDSPVGWRIDHVGVLTSIIVATITSTAPQRRHSDNAVSLLRPGRLHLGYSKGFESWRQIGNIV